MRPLPRPDRRPLSARDSAATVGVVQRPSVLRRGSGVMSLNSVISDSLLGDWTRASNILVRKAAEREEETPRSQVDPADFQLEARAELSGPAKR